MQPGDLVRVRNFAGRAALKARDAVLTWVGVWFDHRGKVGVVVEVNRRDGVLLTYDVLLDGGIVNLHGVYLELVNEAG
jgi:hypothetical protein